MAKIYMPGSGGPNLKVQTATEDDVVAPKVILDKNGKPLTGKLVDRASVTGGVSVGVSSGNVYTRIPVGAYRTPTGMGYPEITMPQSAVAAAGRLTADKMLSNQSAFGIPGNVPVNGSGVASTGRGINAQGLYYYIPRGYYHDGGGNPWVYSSQADVASAIGLTADKMIKGQSCLGINGTTGYCYGLPTNTANTLFRQDGVSAVTMTQKDLENATPANMTLLWQGSVHPEWPYAVFYLSYDQIVILGKGGTYRESYYLWSYNSPTMITYKFVVERDANGYTKFYQASTSFNANFYTYLYCVGGTSEDING